jgi:Protein of unknown function (DUF1674)
MIKVLTPEAQRALAEAEERRKKATKPLPKEVGGTTEPEPTHFGDWEKKGIASDFWFGIHRQIRAMCEHEISRLLCLRYLQEGGK